MKPLFLFYFLIGILLNLHAQKKDKIKGNGIIATKHVEVTDFSALEISENYTIKLMKGTHPSVSIDTDENLLDCLKVGVNDGKLFTVSDKDIRSNSQLDVRIVFTESLKHIYIINGVQLKEFTIKDIPDLTLHSSDFSKASIFIRSNTFNYINSQRSKINLTVEAKQINLELKESSQLKGTLTGKNLTVSLDQNASAIVEGEVSAIDASLKDHSSFYAKNLATLKATITSEVSGKSTLNVSDTLQISASGKSVVNVLGEPKINIASLTGTSSLNKLAP